MFFAGLIPGLLLAAAFMILSAILCAFWSSLGGTKRQSNLKEKIKCLCDLFPTVGLFVFVVGSIYAGIATPTEAAAVGVVFALIIAIGQGGLTINLIMLSLRNALRTTAMIMLAVIGAYVLNFVLAATGVNRALQDLLHGLGFGPLATLIVIVLIFIILGHFIETLSLMVATI